MSTQLNKQTMEQTERTDAPAFEKLGVIVPKRLTAVKDAGEHWASE